MAAGQAGAGQAWAGQAWDAERYDASFGFVSAAGQRVLDLLDARPGERVVDLGCGTGDLTARIAAAGADVVGLDADPAMVARARTRHPGLRVEVADGHAFAVDAPVDAVFSNAALHWMLEPARVVAAVARALRPGGRFVAEMGGVGNVAAIEAAVRRARARLGLDPDVASPWWFPSPAVQAGLLEAAGLEVRLLELVDRPTPLDDCPEGAADWVRMFGAGLVADVPEGPRRDQLARLAAEECAPVLRRDGRWVADYRRLRWVAVRLG